MCQCASLKLSSSQLKVYGEALSKKICKISEKSSKKWKPQRSSRVATRGVYGVYLFKKLTLCAPQFQGRSYRFPFLSSRSPLWLEGFQPTVYVCTLKNINIVFFFDVAIRKVLGAYRANSFALRAYFPAFPICNPESFECFPDTFVGFLALPCVFLVSLPFLLEKLYINKQGRPCRPISLGNFFQNEMQKIKSPPRPKPLAKL